MLISVFSDIHIHNYKPYDKGGSRLDNCLECLEEIICTSHDRGIHNVIFCGDLFDKPHNIPKVVLDKLTTTLQVVLEDLPVMKLYMISGNHDHYDLKGSHNLHTLEKLCTPSIHVFPDLDWIDIGGVKICGINYRKDWDNSILGKIPSDDMILLLHQTPDECSPVIEGDFSASDPIFSPFKHVFCGHIHKHQRLTENFTVVGSPLHRDKGDIGEDKGFLIYDTETNEIELVKLDFPQFKVSDREEDDFNYWVIKPKIEVKKNSTQNDFNSTLKPKQLLENYLKELEVEDKYLSAGLELLKKVQ